MCYSLVVKRLSTKWFKKWSKRVGLTNKDLLEAINNLEGGLSTTDLGSHLFKVRVKREHSGKSSGFRTIIVYRKKIKQFSYMDLEKTKNRILTKLNYNISRN